RMPGIGGVWQTLPRNEFVFACQGLMHVIPRQLSEPPPRSLIVHRNNYCNSLQGFLRSRSWGFEPSQPRLRLVLYPHLPEKKRTRRVTGFPPARAVVLSQGGGFPAISRGQLPGDHVSVCKTRKRNAIH